MSIYDLVKAEARLFKYGSGTGLELQRHPRQAGEALGRRHVVGPHVVPRGVRPRGGRDQERRHDAPRGEDGLPRHGPPGDRGLHQLEGARGEEGARAHRRRASARDFNGEAYHTISGQNSNNSVRVTDEFMRAVEAGGKWQTRFRTTGEVCETLEAKDLWRQVAEAAWGCADPGVQYDSTINRWHTCPNSGRINASNPCSEYMFLDDTACNLASVNLTKFLREDGSFDVEGYRHACRVFFMAQEILVDLSSYPTANIAKNSHDYRPLGLGYANLGSLLMSLGVPYDSREGRAIAAALTAIMCGHAYRDERRDGRRQGPLPRLREEPRADAARDAHAPRRGVRHRSRRVPGRPLPRRVRGLGRGGAPRRGARLPQRAGHGARADGDHRPADGLRHDGHRAGLRAREVQEARRRRVLQDRQPDGAARAPPPRLHASARCRRSSRTSRARTRSSRRRTSTGARSRRRASPTPSSRRSRRPSRACSTSTARSRRGSSARTPTSASARRKELRGAEGLLAARAPRLHARARSTRRATSSSAA